MAVNAPPAGSYLQGNQVYLQNGQPYMSGGMPVYTGSGGVYTTVNPSATTAQSTQANPVISTPPSTGLYNPYGVTIGTPPPSGQTNSSAYVPPEVNALKQIRQIDPKYLRLANKTQSQYLQELRLASGGQLPPGVQREIQQQVAGQEAGTGNTAGVSQAVLQGMTTGTAGLNYYQGVLNAANNYLSAGTNPYAIGSNYVDRSINQQSAAMTGGMMPPTYNPYAGSAPAFSYINPNTGAEFAQGATGFMNAGAGATPGSPDMSGQLIGAGIGAAGSATSALISSGALAGIGGALAAF